VAAWRRNNEIQQKLVNGWQSALRLGGQPKSSPHAMAKMKYLAMPAGVMAAVPVALLSLISK